MLFATHGFLGGEFVPGAEPPAESLANLPARPVVKTRGQPALALTLVGDLKGEDGMLTMKEVIEDLELNADLVALSACNTAGETAQANNGEGFAGLRQYIRANRQSDFVKGFTGKMLAFALGRSLALSDEPLIDTTTKSLAANGYRFETIIENIVTSRQFLNKRGRETE